MKLKKLSKKISQFLGIISLGLFLANCSPNNGISVNSSPAVILAINLDQTKLLIANTCSQANTIQTQDLNGSPTAVTYAQTINLQSSTTDGSFYSDSACTDKIDRLTIAANTSSTQFYFKSVQAEYLTVTASTTNLQAVTVSQTIISPDAVNLSLTGPSSLGVGNCSAPFTVTTENSAEVPSDVTDSVVINLSLSGSGSIYSTADCSGAVIKSITVAPNTQSQQFYFKSTISGFVNLTAQAPGPVIANFKMTTKSADPAQLSFLTNQQSITAGNCSSVLTIQSQDQYGNPATSTANNVISLSGAGILFYTDSSCSTLAVTTIPLPAGLNSASFYVSSNSITSNLITASGFGSQSQTLVVSPAAASQLFMQATLPSPINAGSVISNFNVQVQDQFGNPVTSSLNQVILRAYKDSACSISSTSTLSGLLQAYPQNGVAAFAGVNYTKAEAIYIGASSTGLQSICSSQVSVTPNIPATVAIAGPTTIQAGVCSQAISATSTDLYGNISPVASNLTLSVSGNNKGAFYLTSNCSGTPITSFQINSGSSVANVYFKDSTLEKLTLSFAGLGNKPVTDIISVTAGPTTTLSFSGPATTTAGLCTSGYTLTTLDTFGNVAPVAANFNINLTGLGHGSFYSDLACSNQIILTTIPVGSSSQKIYFIDDISETLSIVASSSLNNPTVSTIISSSTPSSLGLNPPSTATAGVSFPSFQVTVSDQYGNLSPLVNENITLTSYSDSVCSKTLTPNLTGTVEQTSLNGLVNYKDISNGESQTIFIKATSTTGLNSPCSSAISVLPGSVSKALINGPLYQNIDTCSQVFSITSTDSFGNVSPVTKNEIMALSSNGSGSFYSTASCSGSPISSVTIANNTTATSFYYKDNKSEQITITAINTDLGTSSTLFSISPSAAVELGFTGQTNVNAGLCSSAFQVNTEDDFGNKSNITSNLTVNLSGGSGVFYSDINCTSSISSVQILSGTNSKSFYFKDTKSETANLTGAAVGMQSGNFTLSVNALVPSKITLVGQTSLAVGSCSNAYSINSLDQYGNSTYSSSNQVLTTSGLGSAILYSDSSCSTVLNSLVLNSGSSSIQFYINDSKSETLNFNISSTIGSATSNITVTAAPPASLVFENSPKSIIAGQCSGALVIQGQDQYGNPISSTSNQTVTVSGSGLTFYSTAGCSGVATTSVQIPSGANSVNVYVKSTNTSANLVSATAFSSTATQAITILASDPSSLTFATQPQSSIIAGVVFNPIKLQLLDQYSNVIQVSNPITLKTYSDSTCQTLTGSLSGTTQQLIVSGSATYSDLTYTIAQTVYMGASISGYNLSACSTSITVTPPTATKITISPPNSTMSAGACFGPIAVTTKDPFNNTSNATATTIVNLTNSGSGLFYSNNNCILANSITSVTIPLGGNTQNIYFSDTKAESIYLIGATTNLSTTNYPMSVIPLAATMMAVSGLTSFDSTLCSPSAFNITSLDIYNNPSSVATSAVITLAGSGSGNYYSDSSCSNVVTNLTIASGLSSTHFYFLDNTKENLTLSLNSASLSSTTYRLNILDPPATKLGLTGPSTLTAGTCSTAYTVTAEQTTGVSANVANPNGITLAGNGSGVYYSDSSCTIPITSITLATGTSSSNFYFKDKASESLFLSATSSTLIPAQLSTVVTGGSVVKIAFNTVQNTIAGQTIPSVTASYVDSFGNTIFSSSTPIVISLQLATGGAASSMSGTFSETPASGSTGLATFSNLSITKTGTYVLFATGASVTGTSSSFVISAAAPDHFVKNAASDNQKNYFNSALAIPIKATVQDIYNNPAPGINITFDPQSSGGAFNPTSGLTLTDGTIQSTFTTGVVSGIINFQMVGSTFPSGNQYLPFTATDGPQLSASVTSNTLSGGSQTAISVTGWNYTCTTNSAIGSTIGASCLDYIAGFNYTGSPIVETLTITSNWNTDVVTKSITITPEATVGSSLTQGSNNAYGSSIAVYKNILAIGAPNDNSGGTACGAVYFYQGTYPTRATNNWTYTGKLIPSYCQTNMHFGQSVSLYENLLAVGAPGELGPTANLTNAGAVFVYLYNNTSQTFANEVVLRQTTPAANDNFGKVVSISHNYLAASAPTKTVSSSANAGQISLFNLTSATNNTWATFQTLNATTPIANSLYGTSLSLYSGFGSLGQNSFLAIGSPNVNNGGNVYTYESLNNANFGLETIKTASDSSAGNLYGTSVSLFGPYLVVGSPGTTTGKGAVYIYKNSTSTMGWAQSTSTNWSTEFKLQPGTLTNTAAFGTSVSMFGNYLITGAPGQNNGTAFVYQKSNSVPFAENQSSDWTSFDTLVSSNGQTGDNLGTSIAIYDNRLVAGMASNKLFQYTGNWTYNLWPFGFDGPFSILSNTTITAGSVYDYSLVNIPSSYTLTINPTAMTTFVPTYIGSAANIEIDGTIIGENSTYGGATTFNAPDEDGTQNGEVLTPSESTLIGGTGGTSGSPSTAVAGNSQTNGMGGIGASGNDGINITVSGGSGGGSGTSGIPLYFKTMNNFLGTGTINLSATNGSAGFVGSAGNEETIAYTAYYDCSYRVTEYAPTQGNDNYVAWSCGGNTATPNNCLGFYGCTTRGGSYPDSYCEPFGNSPTNCQLHYATTCSACWFGTFSGAVYTYSCDVLIPQTCSTPSSYVAYSCGGGGGGGGAGGSGGDLFVRYKNTTTFNPSDIIDTAGIGGVGALGGSAPSGGSCTGSTGSSGVNGVVGTYNFTQFQ